MMKKNNGFFAAKQGKILQIALSFITILFIAILIGAYLIAKRANPVFLDEQGKPVQTEGEARGY